MTAVTNMSIRRRFNLIIVTSLILSVCSLFITSGLAYENVVDFQQSENLQSRSAKEATITRNEADILREDTVAEQSKRRGRYSNSANSGQESSHAAAIEGYPATAPVGNLHQNSASLHSVDLVDYASIDDTPANGLLSSPAVASASAALHMPASEYVPYSNYLPSYQPPISGHSSLRGHPANHHHHQRSHYRKTQPMGNHDHHHLHSNLYDTPFLADPFGPHWASSPLTSVGLLSTASSALSRWTHGFSVGEIICGLIALSLGAIILGAPFFLIYLALVGNFSGAGSLSLINPNSAATPATAAPASARRKRMALVEQLSNTTGNQQTVSQLKALSNALMSEIHPSNVEQISSTLKRLYNSIEKFSVMKDENQL